MGVRQVVIAPIVLGIIVNHLFGDFIKRAVKLLPLVSIVAILLIVGGGVSVNAARILATVAANIMAQKSNSDN